MAVGVSRNSGDLILGRGMGLLKFGKECSGSCSKFHLMFLRGWGYSARGTVTALSVGSKRAFTDDAREFGEVEWLEANKGELMLGVCFINYIGGLEWGFEIVSGLVGEDQGEFLHEIGVGMRGGIPWVLGGDFNTIDPEERVGCKVWSREMEEFSKFIDNHCLIDYLPFVQQLLRPQLPWMNSSGEDEEDEQQSRRRRGQADIIRFTCELSVLVILVHELSMQLVDMELSPRVIAPGHPRQCTRSRAGSTGSETIGRAVIICI
ncbi:hypothetical protein HAX54_026606 [Datura stramonium]|uniref:Endonuclease/exonuclease/phosphatase domain-containing protein n=1 Tax=Datura stramonium TaxID=4076 RepID=A0ABS8S7Y5_DATST|nr:hypothetical protein [Datura stramonium]